MPSSSGLRCEVKRIVKAQSKLKVLLLLFLLAVTLLRMGTLSSHPLLEPTESRYAEISREMSMSGDWITPKLDNRPFWGKPPLTFWLIAASYDVLGINEFSSRLPSLMVCLLMLGMTYVLAAELGGSLFGLGCAAILASTGMWYAISGMVMTDPYLAACTTLSMTAFLMAMIRDRKPSKRLWGYLFFIGLGLGLLAKGLVAPVFVLIPLAIWWKIKRIPLRRARELPWLGGMALMMLIALPWHLLAELHSPGFLDYYIVGEHFKRFLVKGWQGNLYGKSHNEPLGMIWIFFLGGTLPWSLIAFFGLRTMQKRKFGASLRDLDAWSTLLLIWMLMPVVFFTFARNILAPYVLPALPPFAVLTGMLLRNVLRELGEKEAKPKYLRPRSLTASMLFVPLGFTVAAYTLLPYMGARNSQKALVAKFEEMVRQEGHGSELFYVGPLPYSGEFYSRGAVKALTPEGDDSLKNELSDGDRDFFAYASKNRRMFSEQALKETEEIGSFGNFTLRRER